MPTVLRVGPYRLAFYSSNGSEPPHRARHFANWSDEVLADADYLREGVRVLAQELMELELAEHVGAERHERTLERSGYRNGYRERPWDTRVGSIELQVPRVRHGSFFPSLLEPRRRAE